jgi:hypothetical protein
MISRRIAEHVRSHNWFAVGIDLVIVVLGVFIGLQVQEWNTARQARARAESYSLRLTEDLRYEAWHWEYLIAYYKDVRENAQRAIAAMTDGPPLSDSQFLISAYRASQYYFNEMRRSTYDEMVATGDIGLIADQRLRDTALSFFANPVIDVTTDEAKHSEYRRVFRRGVPADIQHVLLAVCGDRYIEPGDFRNITGSINYDCTLDLPAEKISAAAAALRENPEFLPTLRLRFADLETWITNLETYSPELRGNLRAIAQEHAP